MPRADLLALTLEDLAALTNRGTVKRAARELESGEATFALEESDAGEVRVKWSDDVECVLPAGRTASDGRCSCPATTLCRHVVRSVLAYQRHQQRSAGAGTGTGAGTGAGDGTGGGAGGAASAPAPAAPWDPGEITDDELARHYRKPALAAAAARFAQGVLVELVRSAKPTARFHQLACTRRCAVPGDVRYTHCDCADAAPCGHVPLAVWAFRQLPRDQAAGVVSTQRDDLPVPAELLDAGDALLLELADAGVSGLPSTWKDRALRLAGRCEAEDLVWPGGVLAELVQQYERYAAHDARFAPDRVAELAGEWLIRAGAIRSRTRATPQLLIRGSSRDRTTDIGSARYVGIGCGAHVARGGVTLTAYLQDADSGSVVAVARDFADPPKDAPGDGPKDFHRLAQQPVVRDISLAALGGGQLLLQGGKRAPDHRLVVGRARASANPQGYAWEALRAPVLAADFNELRARLGALPPASLRPRYVAADLHVVPVASVVAWQFDEASQSVEVLASDARGEVALIRHPFVARARDGAEALLAALADGQRHLRFAAGQVRPSARGLVIYPVTLVFEKGGVRSGIQPWVDRAGAGTGAGAGATTRGDAASASEPSVGAALPSPPDAPVAHAVDDFPAHLLTQLGELFLLGLRRADASAARTWAQLALQGQSLGYHRLLTPVAALGEELQRKLSTPRWTSAPAARLTLETALLAKLAQDVSS